MRKMDVKLSNVAFNNLIKINKIPIAHPSPCSSINVSNEMIFQNASVDYPNSANLSLLEFLKLSLWLYLFMHNVITIFS